MIECRPGCGACCIAPSITSYIPGMPMGKAAGQRCVQLSVENKCLLFGIETRPRVCVGIQASEEMCGENFKQAMQVLTCWEELTKPDR